MALVRYKILESDIVESTAYIPEKAIPLGLWNVPEPAKYIKEALSTSAPVIEYKMKLAFMIKYEDWVKEFPEEAKKEKEQQGV